MGDPDQKLLLSLIDQQAQTINDLAKHNQNLLQLESRVNETLNTVSHELRTPLANILGFSELLIKNSYGEKDLKFYLNEIYTASLRLNGIIDHFLDIAKIKNGGLVQKDSFTLCDLEDLASQAWRNAARPKEKVKVKWLIDENLPKVLCDAEAIVRVISNLFGNALKFSDKKEALITCQISKNNNEIYLSIKDNGKGIEKDELDKIFEKFYRAKNSSNVNGSGLGLWICRQIIKAHDGNISCKSEPNKGSEFVFSLKIGNNE